MTTDTRTQHTAGPWHKCSVQIADYPIDIIAGRVYVGSALREPDARLMEAAPDLLAALENAEGWLEGLSWEVQLESQAEFYEMWDQVRAAIAKARGEE